ncbi:hypothetical protein KCU85_g3729, partial [Aureobasidium melanogenum]
MVSVDFPSTTFTDVVVEFFSGRRDKQTVFHSIEAVLKSLRQPPSFKNNIRLAIIESATRTVDEKADLIKSIKIETPYVNYPIADRHIMAATDGPRITHSWYFPDPEMPSQSSSESGDGRYTPDSEPSSPTEEHNSNQQSLAERVPSHIDASENITLDDIADSLACVSVLTGIVGAFFDIISYLRANPNFLRFEPWTVILNACLTHIWKQACLFGFPVLMSSSLIQMYRRERG